MLSPTPRQYRFLRAIEGGTCVWSDETEVRIREAALPRAEKECQPTVCDMRTGELVPVAEKTA